MTRRLTYDEECWLRETAAKHAQGKHVAIISGELVLLALAELDALRGESQHYQAELNECQDALGRMQSERDEALAKLSDLENEVRRLSVYESTDAAEAVKILENLASFVGCAGSHEPTPIRNLEERVREGIRYEVTCSLNRERATKAERDRLESELADCKRKADVLRRERDEAMAKHLDWRRTAAEVDARLRARMEKAQRECDVEAASRKELQRLLDEALAKLAKAERESSAVTCALDDAGVPGVVGVDGPVLDCVDRPAVVVGETCGAPGRVKWLANQLEFYRRSTEHAEKLIECATLAALRAAERGVPASRRERAAHAWQAMQCWLLMCCLLHESKVGFVLKYRKLYPLLWGNRKP